MGKEKNDIEPGKIFVVSTPIGNLEDITLRALRVLKEVGLIAAESREHTRKLCTYYTINTPITSYNANNQRYKGRLLIDKVMSGVDIALVSSAGTPGLSDPGFKLIKEAVKKKIQLVPVPGVSASMAALSVSGLRTDSFIFIGFLSNKQSRRRKELERLITEKRTIIFFESPHRLYKMVKDMYEIFGDRHMALAKEITKVFEKVKRGSISEILCLLQGETIKGEYTLIVEGAHNKNTKVF